VADDQQSVSGMVPAMVEAFTGQLRAVTEGLEELAGLSQRARPAAGVFPLPGALSAAQLASLADSIAAQRRCARTFSLMMAASLAVRTWVRGKAPLVVFRRGLGVRAGGLVVSLT
jgi:hypothetical protein